MVRNTNPKTTKHNNQRTERTQLCGMGIIMDCDYCGYWMDITDERKPITYICECCGKTKIEENHR